MKFAALLSGGKDSIYSIQKAIDFGHQLVCVVNLFPADESIDELNR
jgi:diphthamide synthase (EF-2-diphthine--ammonia ligase)